MHRKNYFNGADLLLIKMKNADCQENEKFLTISIFLFSDKSYNVCDIAIEYFTDIMYCIECYTSILSHVEKYMAEKQQKVEKSLLSTEQKEKPVKVEKTKPQHRRETLSL